MTRTTNQKKNDQNMNASSDVVGWQSFINLQITYINI